MDWKKLLKLLYPPVWVTILLVPLCIAGLIFVFVKGYENHPAACVFYVVAFYTLCVIVMKCIDVIPKHYKHAKKKVYDNPIGEKFMTDMKFRTHVGLYATLGVNLLYVAVNILSGFMYNTVWFYVLAFYYTILAVMRFILLKFVNRVGIGKNRLLELKRSRFCGIILLTVNLSLSGVVLMMMYQNKGFEYNGIFIYIMAAYTFYITTLAIVNLIRYKKLGSPVMSMAKIISMAAAVVSMLSLETAMFSQFGKEMSLNNQRLMIALTGAGVSIVVITMSVYSIVKNTKEIAKVRNGDDYER